MKANRHRAVGPPALDLIEDAIHRLRAVPAGLLLVYYAGAGPFVLGLLYFWADMSRGTFAEQRLAPGALGLAALFLWMKTAQAVFATELRAHITGHRAGGWNSRRLLRIAVTQAVIQPWLLPLLALASIIAVPLGWVFAYAQNVVVLDDGRNGLRAVHRRAWAQALVWPVQNHAMLAFLSIFGFFLWLNVASGLLLVPWFLKTFLGVETPFSMSLATVLNSTFLATTAGLAWLAVDPILKACYVLRCFHGESRTSGEDLRVELRAHASASAPARAAAALAALLILAGAAVPGARAAEAAPTPAVEPARLDQAIDQVLERREYQWRLPRESGLDAEQEKPWIARQMESLLLAVKRMLLKVRDAIEDFMDWLQRKVGRRPVSRSGDGSGWVGSLHVMVFVLLAVVVCALAILILRAWRQRRRGAVVEAKAVAAVPDVSDENVGADQLPEDGWLKLARELAGRGDLRLALRALYLASLAHLAGRQLIQLARFKSNRDYDREVRRRARAWPAVPAAFADNVAAFDRAWYGRHEVTPPVLAEFERNFDRLRSP